MSGLTDYEKERLIRIEANRRKIQELGLKATLQQITSNPPVEDGTKKRKQREKGGVDPADLRRSGRDRQKISYKEDEYYVELPRMVGPRAPRMLRELDEEEIEELRRRHGIPTPDLEPTDANGPQQVQRKNRGAVDSGKGVRIQGGRVYDSKFGVTCHWCRQKTLEDHVTCSHPNCGKGKRLAISFCKMCLRNRHGEDCELAFLSGAWVCPRCRGSCGRGCVMCCNCGPCRKKAGLEPTHQIVKSAKEAGFDNVHDYLVHLVTGDPPEVLAERKLLHKWGQWMKEDEETLRAGHEEREAAAAEAEAAAPPAGDGGKGQQQPGAGPQQQEEDGAAAGKPAPKARRPAKRKAADGAADGEADEQQDVAGPSTRRPAVKRQRKAAGASNGGQQEEPHQQQQHDPGLGNGMWPDMGLSNGMWQGELQPQAPLLGTSEPADPEAVIAAAAAAFELWQQLQQQPLMMPLMMPPMQEQQQPLMMLPVQEQQQHLWEEEGEGGSSGAEDAAVAAAQEEWAGGKRLARKRRGMMSLGLGGLAPEVES